jgi:antitoxin (DNA-binding transcriptional repressor) of toxin-antitoxin stability system
MKEKKLKQVTVTDVRYHFPKVERLLRRGEVLQVTRRNKVFAEIVPASLFNREKKQEPSKAKG